MLTFPLSENRRIIIETNGDIVSLYVQQLIYEELYILHTIETIMEVIPRWCTDGIDLNIRNEELPAFLAAMSRVEKLLVIV